MMEDDKLIFLGWYRVRKIEDVNAKSLLDYLAKVIGVSRQSDSLRYVGEPLPDGKTVYIDLTQYEVIPYESITHDNIPQEK